MPSSRPLSGFDFGCAGKSRLSSQCLQHPLFLDALQAPLQKIDFQSLLANLPFQLSDFGFIPAPLSASRKGVARTMTEFLPPPVQQVRVDFKRASHLRDRCPPHPAAEW